MMGCFSSSASKVVKQRSSSAPRSGPLKSVIASKDSLSLLSNKPVELPEPGSILSSSRSVLSSGDVAKARVSDELEVSLPGHRRSRTQILKGVEEGRTAFSGPLVGSVARDERVGKTSSSRLAPNYESGCETPQRNSCGLRTLRRTASFGGRPQPLPLPITEEEEEEATLAPANAKAKQEVCLPLPAPEDAGRRSRRVKSFALEDGAGLRSARRGRVAPVGGLPLPPPALAGKFLPSLAEFEPADFVVATDDGAVARGAALGNRHRARVKDLVGHSHPKIGVAVFRLPGNAAQKPDDELVLLEANSETETFQLELVEGYNSSFNWHDGPSNGEYIHCCCTERIVATGCVSIRFPSNSWSSDILQFLPL